MHIRDGIVVRLLSHLGFMTWSLLPILPPFCIPSFLSEWRSAWQRSKYFNLWIVEAKKFSCFSKTLFITFLNFWVSLTLTLSPSSPLWSDFERWRPSFSDRCPLECCTNGIQGQMLPETSSRLSTNRQCFDSKRSFQLRPQLLVRRCSLRN